MCIRRIYPRSLSRILKGTFFCAAVGSTIVMVAAQAGPLNSTLDVYF